MNKHIEKVLVAEGKEIVFETGLLAKQADGAAVVKMGDSMVLCTMCTGSEGGSGFFPLTVEYREKAYAAGKIPGGFVKREARPSESEILTARLIDRPIRPMFPEGFMNEVQVILNVLSADASTPCDTLGISAASLSAGLSSTQFEQQVAAVRVAFVEGSYIINPSHEEMDTSDLEMVVAGTESSVVMVEGGAWEVAEDVIVAGIMEGHKAIKLLCQAQQKVVDAVGKEKEEFVAPEVDKELFDKIKGMVSDKLDKAFHTPMVKTQHYPAMAQIEAELIEELGEEYEERVGEVKELFGEIKRTAMREMILNEGVRIDGRATTDIRPIYTEAGLVPNAHGSALFQRGETQGLVVVTLGSKSDEQMVETLYGSIYKNYMLHYNFPPFSVGECKRVGSVSRREIGHGHLAERALAPVLPHPEDFPYTIRVVSEILESNGSSSMASVCGGSLSLMDTGIPVKTSVAGIAMGLISEGDKVKILSDITGTEDHLGDMDFKVTGTTEGITAFQMDIKIKGITPELMSEALNQANAGRKHILAEMGKTLSEPRAELPDKAPSIITTTIKPAKIREVIGPGGAVIKGIQEKTGVDINISDDGMVVISAPSNVAGKAAEKMVHEIVAEVEKGKVYEGTVKKLMAFGAFVEVLPGKEGLCHISELSHDRVEKVEDVVQVGDKVTVQCINIDNKGRVNLSIKATMDRPDAPADESVETSEESTEKTTAS